MIAPHAVAPDPLVVRRQNELFDLYNQWPGDGDPDDDPDFVAAARSVMGLPPLPTSDVASRAAGHDTTVGHDELHHYWTKDPEGLAKWVDSPTPWTTLVGLLTEHVGPEKAKVFASRWFFEHFGFYSGSDKNRVAHGHPPRGNRVGPG